MNNTKGSHVGIIASFGIFVMFLVGIYFVMEPALNTEKDKSLLLEYLELKLVEEFSGNLTTATISLNGTGCQKLTNSAMGINSRLNAIVRDSSEIIISNYSGTDLLIESGSEMVLWVYYSDVNLGGGGIVNGVCNNSIINSVRSEEHIFEEKIISRINDFETLKGKLNIPPGSDFSFIFEMSNKTQVSAGVKNVSVSVYSKEAIIQYMDKEANILTGKLIIRVW